MSTMDQRVKEAPEALGSGQVGRIQPPLLRGEVEGAL